MDFVPQAPCDLAVEQVTSAAERARVLEIARYFQAASITKNDEAVAIEQGIRHPPDATLTALAQLGCFRLDCNRSYISLINSAHQYIIGEATRSISVSRPDRHRADDGLYLGFSVHPLSFGVCPQTIKIFTSDSSHDAIDTPNISANRSRYIIRDFTEDARFSTKPYVKDWPHMRSYAEVPLISPSGFVIGSYCVIDDRPRNFDDDEISVLAEIASTIMDTLDLRKDRLQKDRAERLVDGLSSYLEEGLALRRLHPGIPSTVAIATTPALDVRDTGVQPPASPPSKTDSESNISSSLDPSLFALNAYALDSTASPPDKQNASQELPSGFPKDEKMESTDREPSAALKNELDAITDDSEAFSKAGTIICQAMNLKGIAFLNADSNNCYNGVLPSSSGVPISLSQDTDPSCTLLSYSSADEQSPSNVVPSSRFTKFSQKLLKKLLARYPFGHVFCFDDLGAVSTDSVSEGQTMGTRPSRVSFTDSKGHGTLTDGSNLAAELAMLVGPACSIIVLPLWSFQQERWAAAAIGWVTEPTEILKKSDLMYMTAFGNSIMTELLNQQATALSLAKSNFISSVSHELRSPLHGILACVELLRETIPFTHETSTILDNANACGGMLLDTMNHLLDFAKINRLAVTRGHGMEPGAGNDLNMNQVRLTTTNLWMLVEEVVEGMHIAYVAQSVQDGTSSTTSQIVHGFRAKGQGTRNDVVLLLDIEPSAKWVVSTEVGAWKRIVMNLVGNALKYTTSGHIQVQLKLIDVPIYEGSNSGEFEQQILLQVNDTGQGMSSDYVRHKLFTPFAQESNLSSGLGLGLYIVQQLANSLDGSVKVRSALGIGTSVAVQIPFGSKTRARASDSSLCQPIGHLLDPQKRLQGREVVLTIPSDCIDAAGNVLDESNFASKQTPVIQTLASIAKSWLGMKVSLGTQMNQTRANPGSHALPLLTLSTSEGRMDAPWTLNLIYSRRANVSSPEEANTVIEPTKVTLRHPFGPTKLARSFLQAIDERDTTPSMSDVSASESRPSARSAASDKRVGEKVLNSAFEGALEFIKSDSCTDLAVPLRLNATDEKTSAASEVVGINSATTSITPPYTAPKNVANTSRRPHVLLVDDNEINLKILASCVKKEGCTFEQAANGQEAVDLFKADANTFDLIFMDISMPVMDGCTASSEMRAFEQKGELSRTSIIALTALGSEQSKQHAFASGVDDFIMKPFSMKEIRALLKSLQLD